MSEPFNDTQNEDKTVAILSYITLIGWIIAFVMHGSKKTKLGTYHLRQGLGLNVLVVGFMFLNVFLAFIPILGWLLSLGIGITLLIFWIFGLLSAINGENKPIPLIGKPMQSILKDLGN